MTGCAKRIERWEKDGVAVSTILAGDTLRFETAVIHPEFNDGRWVVVQEADTEEDARKMHSEWVKVAEENTTEELHCVRFGRTHIRQKPETTTNNA